MTIRHLKAATRQALRTAAQAYGHVRRRYSAAVRRVLGVGFIIGGFLFVLPVFGLWMLPVGLALLSDDVPYLRRMRRNLHARLLAWAHDRQRRPRIFKRMRGRGGRGRQRSAAPKEHSRAA